MSSIIFQPLLHDPLGWKSEKSTYTEHYKWKKYRSRSKPKKTSMPTIPVSIKKPEEKPAAEEKPSEEPKLERIRAKTATCRSSSAKSALELRQRPASAAETALPKAEEETTKVLENKQIIVDPNNENSRHWLTYPNPTTPQYIIEVKHRLGQLKKSSLESYNLQTLPSTPPARPTSASSQKQQTNADDQHRFFDFERRQTPDALRAARYRLDKHRYNPSLDQLPIRPKTAPVVEPSNNENAENQQIISEQTTEIEANPIKTDAWANENDEQSQTSFTVQVVDCDGLPPEYAEALKTAAVAQEEYQRTIKSATGRNSDRSSPVVRPPPIENQIDSVMAYQQQLPTSAVNNNFGSWVRNATDKERASAMKILQEVLNQPIVGYDPPNKKKSHLKTAPAPPPVRAASATRKLGRTRTQHRFPCEICEKLLIKRHVWDLSRPENGVCPHQPERISVRS